MHMRLARAAWALQQAHTATRARTSNPDTLSSHVPLHPLLYHVLSSILGNCQLPWWCGGTQDLPQQQHQLALIVHPHAGLQQPIGLLQQNADTRSYSSQQREAAHEAAKPGKTEAAGGRVLHSKQQQQDPSTKGAEATSADDAGGSGSGGSTGQPTEPPAGEHAASAAHSNTAADSEQSRNSSNSSSDSSSHQDQSGSGDEDEENVTDLLVEWRLRTSEWYGGGLNYVINSHLQMPQMTTWATLYPGTSPLGFLARLVFPKGSSILTLILKWQFKGSRQIAIPLLETAHEELSTADSIEDFKQNLGMAITTVLELYSKADWQALRPMVSAGLLESMQAAYDAQLDTVHTLEQSGIKVEDVRLEVEKLDIVCAHAISRAQLAAIDEDRSKAQLPDSTGSSSSEANAMWDVVHVYVESKQHATLRTPDGIERTSQPKTGHWVFCRGPVQFDKVVSAEADLLWFILAWL